MSLSFVNHPQQSEFVDFIGQMADAAGEYLVKRRQDNRFQTKADASPVTEFDRGVELMLRQMIRATYPDHGIIGEEFDEEQADAEFVWVMDPIDGTKSFVAGIPVFTTLIALCRWGVPVIGVIDASTTGDRWVGVSGLPTTQNGVGVRTSARTAMDGATVSWSNPEVVLGAHAKGKAELNQRTAWRVFGAAAYGFGRLASGSVDLAVESGTVGPHDLCAFVPVIEGAGGVVTDGFGGPISFRTDGSCLAAATPELHAEALGVLNTV